MTPMVKHLSSLQQRHAPDTGANPVFRKMQDERRNRRPRAEQARTGSRERETRVRCRFAVACGSRDVTLDAYLIGSRRKARELEGVALECFRTLSEERLVHCLTIEAATFGVTLFDDRGQAKCRRASLSAGEKQIYAISLLWALAKVSGRPLPMIIDTPLGRLDSVRTTTLLENYFPFASHQSDRPVHRH